MILIGKTKVSEFGDSVAWCAGLEIDGDGAPNCYSPPGSDLPALDYIANAGSMGNWYGLACDEEGNPYIQGPDDECPGYYVSTTALVDHDKEPRDPKRYVDSCTVPYIAVPPELLRAGVHKGDLAWVQLGALGCAAIVADVGPHGHLGEGSCALAEALGLPASPKSGGTGRGVKTVVFLNTRAIPAWPRDVAEFSTRAAELYAAWGGDGRLVAID